MNNLVKNVILTPFNILYKISPVLDLKLLFRLKVGYKLNLKNPQTFNEKLQWIKLNIHDPLMPKCCDKYTVREYVKECGCEEILNTLLWEGFHPEDIPFDTLPEQFVIKVTHGSTYNIICTDKSKLDYNDVIRKCNKWLKHKFLPCYGEWFYGVEKPRVIVEKYLHGDENGDLKDYKVFVFNGKACYVDVHSERFAGHKRDFYTIDWERLEGYRLLFENSEKTMEKPDCLDKLLDYAVKINGDFVHSRVDFYIVDNQIYFGEITFTNGAGFDKFYPQKFDLEMGQKMELPIRGDKKDAR